MKRISDIGPEVAYQATDLARRHRKVIDSARTGHALLRDKDGTALLLAPAADVERAERVADLALALIKVRQALDAPPSGRSVAVYGDLAWISALPEEQQRACLGELTDALLVAASGTSLRNIDLLLDEWRATADAWADPDIRARLLAEERTPSNAPEL